MNIDEYIKAEKTLKEEFEEKKKQLAREFAYSNNDVKIGDIITDQRLSPSHAQQHSTPRCSRSPALNYQN